jgi:hypothetical protein
MTSITKLELGLQAFRKHYTAKVKQIEGKYSGDAPLEYEAET